MPRSMTDAFSERVSNWLPWLAGTIFLALVGMFVWGRYSGPGATLEMPAPEQPVVKIFWLKSGDTIAEKAISGLAVVGVSSTENGCYVVCAHPRHAVGGPR